jgi:DNA-binding NtrC family response regulator
MANNNAFNVDKQLKKLAEAALTQTKGNRTEAAELLGISVRTLRNWINKYSLARDYPPPKKTRK